MDETNPKLCEACKNLKLTRHDFETPPFEPEGRYGQIILTDTVENLQKKHTPCSLCSLFWTAISKNEQTHPELLLEAREYEVAWAQSTMEYEPVDEDDHNTFGSALYPRLCHRDCHSDYCVQLVDDRDTTSFLRGRSIPLSIEPAMLSGWLARCKEEHGAECADDSVNPLAIPLQELEFLVVDVVQMCLITLPSDREYVTLSYVWGKAETASTLIANVEQRKVPGSLRQASLPQTILDSIDVVRSIGQRYLWVDALCIVQDHASKLKFIEAMDTVYMRACLCIVAATGNDANAGLSGWSDPDKRKTAIPVNLIEPDLRLGVLPFLDLQLRDSIHATRAWTFQEGALSNRCLIFLDSMVYFCCRKAVWREDMHVESSGGTIPFEDGADTLARALDPFSLRRYQQCVSAYTSRGMRYDTDALRAFTGIQKALARSMNQSRFWNGMPAAAFDWAILWTGARGMPLSRRAEFPSHSWLGWKGQIVPPQSHYAEFDFEWLVSRTWINWHVVDERGECVLLWDPVRDGTIRTDGQVQFEDDRIDIGSSTNTQAENAGEHEPSQDMKDNRKDAQDEQSTAASDEDSENSSPCPQYGWPTQDDPYGRIPAKPLDPLIPSLQSSTTHQKLTSIKPGTLRFQTYVATYKLSHVSPGSLPGSQQKPPNTYFTLSDNQSRVCGIVWDHGTLPVSDRNDIQTKGRDIDILILSYAAPGTKLPFCALKVELPEPYEAAEQDEGADGQVWIQDEWHAWDMLNVMLAIPAPSNDTKSPGAGLIIYERHSVGLLHKNALLHAFGAVRWEEIYLY